VGLQQRVDLRVGRLAAERLTCSLADGSRPWTLVSRI
jgi:hypothetical protein